MKVGRILENIKLCFLQYNTTVQFLSLTSLHFLINDENGTLNKNNYKFFEQLNESLVIIKTEKEVASNRIFRIFLNIEILLYKPKKKSKNNFYYFQKKKKKFKINVLENLDIKFIVKILSKRIGIRNFSYLEEKKIEIMELLCEIKKQSIIVDLVGIIEADELTKDYICHTGTLDRGIEDISFHLFRKLKNFKNIKMLKNEYRNECRLTFIFQDRLIRNENFCDFILFFLKGNFLFLQLWINYIQKNSKLFFKWLRNVFIYNLNVNKTLCNRSFLKIDEKNHSAIGKNVFITNFNDIWVLKLKKCGKFLQFIGESNNSFFFSVCRRHLFIF